MGSLSTQCPRCAQHVNVLTDVELPDKRSVPDSLREAVGTGGAHHFDFAFQLKVPVRLTCPNCQTTWDWGSQADIEELFRGVFGVPPSEAVPDKPNDGQAFSSRVHAWGDPDEGEAPPRERLSGRANLCVMWLVAGTFALSLVVLWGLSGNKNYVEAAVLFTPILCLVVYLVGKETEHCSSSAAGGILLCKKYGVLLCAGLAGGGTVLWRHLFRRPPGMPLQEDVVIRLLIETALFALLTVPAVFLSGCLVTAARRTFESVLLSFRGGGGM